MHPKIAEIEDYIKGNEFFGAIKDTNRFASALYETYPNRDITSELRKASLWLVANPARQKKDYRRFLVNWMFSAFTKRYYPLTNKK